MQIIIEKLLINYQDEGSGQVILFLHGWGSNLENFNNLKSALKTHNRTILLDFPGFGKSQTPKEPWTLNDYAQFVLNFLEKINITKIDLLVAHSFGCRIAIKLLSQNALTPKHTLLLGPAGLKHSDSLQNTLLKIFTKIGKVIFKLPLLSSISSQTRKLLYTKLNSTDYLNLQDPVMAQIFQNTINEDLKNASSKISSPVTFLWGENDTTVPAQKELPLAQACPNATIEILKNAGHYPHHDNPEHILKLINQFLNA